MTKLLGLKPDATYVAIYDTEATGVEEKDRMIQGAFGLYELNTEKKSMKLIKYHEEMINPGDVKINPFAAAVQMLKMPLFLKIVCFANSLLRW